MRLLPFDFVHAARRLLRAPLFTLASVATLALAIGVNAAIFSAVEAVLLRSLPYSDTDRLVSVRINAAGASVDKATLAALRPKLRALTGLAGHSGWSFTTTGAGDAERLEGQMATPALFEVLGSRPALGRALDAGDDQPGTASVVLSDALWRERFGGRADVLGRPLTLNGAAATVVGVMPPGFRFPDTRSGLWVSSPLDASKADDFNAAYLLLVGRLAPGVTPAQARDDLRAALQAVRAEQPDRYPAEFGRDAAVVPLRDHLVGATRPALLALSGAVALVLLIACVNLANLLLARADSRRREIAIRAALGATRGRLVRHLLAESLLLAAAGGAAGLLCAAWSLPLLARLLPPDFPAFGAVRIDAGVLAWTAGISILAGILFGVLPAARAARAGAPRELHAGRHAGLAGAGGHRLQGALVASEVGLAIVLVAAAGLLLKSVRRLERVDTGIRSEGVEMARWSWSGPDRPGAGAQVVEDMRRTLERAAALPGVTRAGAVHLTPLSGNNWNTSFEAEGRPAPAGGAVEVDWRVATPGYFGTAGVPLVQGRLFTEQDDRSAPGVALVNETLARRVFPDGSALGARIASTFEGDKQWVTIVGVVGDTRDLRLSEPSHPQMYRPHAQFPLGSMTLLLRTGGGTAAIAAPLRAAVREAAPVAVLTDVQPLRRMVDDSLRPSQGLLALFGSFGLLALALGAIGVFGVMTYTAGQRIPEFGVRMALGADRRSVLGLVLRHGLGIAALGVLAGVAAAVPAARLLERFLFEVSPGDAGVFAGVALLLLAVSALACLLPALRATRVDPVIALRSE
jgi:putative ABC transport system permease protein